MARGRNDKLEGLVAFLEAEKSALEDKVDKMMADGKALRQHRYHYDDSEDKRFGKWMHGLLLSWLL